MFGIDLSTVIATLALVVSGVTFFWARTVQKDQDRRWDALNAAAIAVAKLEFVPQRRFASSQEAEQVDWGYPPTIYLDSSRFNDAGTTGAKMNYRLYWSREDTGAQVGGTNPFFTLSEAEKERKRAGLPESGVVVRRWFDIVAVLENVGQTPAFDLKVTFRSISGPSLQTAFNAERGATLLPKQSLTVPMTFTTPLITDFPERWDWSIDMTFKDVNGQDANDSIPVTYLGERDLWVFGGGNGSGVGTL